MNGAHFHLLVNHFPIILPIIGVIILLIGMFYKSPAIKQVGYFIFVLAAVSAFISMNSGGEAEDVVKKIEGVSKKLIHQHEESAETYSILCYLLGAISLVGFWASYKQKSFSKILSLIILIFACVIVFLSYQTGNSGGEIMHKEIRDTTLIED